MTKPNAILASAVGLVVAGVLGFWIVHTLNDQAETRRQLDDLKKQMAAATSLAPASTGGATMPTSGPVLPVNPVWVGAGGVTTQNGSALAQQKAVQEYLSEGFRLLNSRDPQNVAQAAKIFREGIDKVDKNNVYLYNGLGRALILSGKYADALQAFQDGQQVDPKRAELVSGAGWAQWNLKQYYQARQSWEAALKLDPNSQDAWMALAWIYLAMGNDELSKQGFVILSKAQSDNKEFALGLTMARAANHNLDQIRAQFKGMPDPAAFLTPPATATSTLPAK